MAGTALLAAAALLERAPVRAVLAEPPERDAVEEGVPERGRVRGARRPRRRRGRERAEAHVRDVRREVVEPVEDVRRVWAAAVSPELYR
jgi:hypothetical protein